MLELFKVPLCSTPFGITEVGIIARVWDEIDCACAQRLSASQRWAYGKIHRRLPCRSVLNAFRHHRGGHEAVHRVADLGPQCSTPFGITEVGIRRRRSTRVVDCVLNAFRHHRGGHLTIATAISWLMYVLNAFRHHRGGHTQPRQAGAPDRPVLNAFRHHRGGHSRWRVSTSTSAARCSTPFGITEVGIRHCGRHSGRRGVLNAFRHHRGGHTSPGWSTSSDR